MNKYVELNNEIMLKKDGFYQLHKDKEAINEYLLQVRRKSIVFADPNERMAYLINNEFYENFHEKYSYDQIKQITKLVYDARHSFNTYTSAFKFYNDYALKNNDKTKYLETYQDRVIALSLCLAEGDFEYAKQLATEIVNGTYQPATPTFLNAGKKRRGEFVSCFLLEIQDSLNSITFNISTAMQLSKIGGGVALHLSNLRASGESIKGVENVGKGIIPIMKLLEYSFNYADQMGQRKGAGAVYLNIFHYEIQEYLDTKKVNADEASRIQTLSMGIVVPDKFIELAKQNKSFYVFAPYSVYKAIGKTFNEVDWETEYDSLVENENIIKKELNARDMLVKISTTQFESGYPYIIYSDNANKDHALKSIGNIRMSNLCTEIFQLQLPSEINNYGIDDDIGYDISCVLGSLNIVNVVNNDLENTVHTAMVALTNVSSKANIQNAPSVKKANNDFHSVGLGVMNLHGFFVKNGIDFESDEAKDFCNVFFMMLNYYSIKSSMLIAKEKGICFKDFKKSTYYTGEYFAKYQNHDFIPTTQKVKDIFNDIFIPRHKDWTELKELVKENGLYHAYRLAIAPTQSISYLHGATMSVMPVSEHIEARTYGNSITYYPMPYLTKETVSLYKSAYNMDMKKLIDLVAVIQQHIDQGISTLLYVTSNNSTRDLVKLYLYAHSKGIKSLYYTRNKNLTIDDEFKQYNECNSCMS